MTAAVLTRRDANWALVERAQAGDRDAFADIYRRYHDRVYRFVYYRCGNRQVAEDLTADVFVKALCRINTVSWQGKDFLAWLTTIARNRLADHHKSHTASRVFPRWNMAELDRPDDDRHGTPEVAALDHINHAALLDAVKRLTPEQRQCVILRIFNDLSVKETAAVMGKNEGAVTSLLARATRALGRDEAVQALAVAA